MAPKTAADVLVPYEWIEAANARWKELQDNADGITKSVNLRLGVDVAGMGRDSSTFCYRYGNFVHKFESHQSAGKADHMAIAGKTKQILQGHDRTSHRDYERSVETFANAYIDTIGEGAGVFSRLQEQGMKNAISCKYSEAAVFRKKPLKDRTDQYEFANMKAYLYWAIRDWLDPLTNSKAALPPDTELAEELTATRWEFMIKERLKLKVKKS